MKELTDLDVLFFEIESHAVMRTHAKLILGAKNELAQLRAELEAANGRLARMRSIIKSHSFAVVLSGETGKRFVRCKECHGDNENKNESDFDFTHVQHFSPCSVAAALKETE